MIIIMDKSASSAQVDHIIEKIEKAGFSVHISDGEERSIIGVKGVTHDIRENVFASMPGVDSVLRVSKPYKEASLEFHPDPTVLNIKGVEIGGREIIVSAGPCSVEGEKMYREISNAVKEGGAKILRGGAFKPRSSPYSFQGMGEEGLKIMRTVGDELSVPVVTEAINPRSLELVVKYADIIQIGARNMQNYDLLKEAGNTGKPVMLKRGMAASIQDFLMSAEYILSEGNPNVILCERGIRTFETATRNTLDISVVPVIKKVSHLPVFIDPSHASGHVDYIESLSLAAVASGADGLIVEVHNSPEEAMSDGEQSLLPGDFCTLMAKIRRVAEAVGRSAE
jgi:3-deoxy-7-phosphoheptulonate synthase